jgi:hypothetical protein
MNREQMIAHLTLQGWAPRTSAAITHQTDGMIYASTTPGMAAVWVPWSSYGIGYEWSDIDNMYLASICQRMSEGPP